MWMRNALFLALCVGGLSAVAWGLLRSNRVTEPVDLRLTAAADDDFRRTLAAIDKEFIAAWESCGLKPTPAADNLTIVRRLSLGLTGTVPSVEELRALDAIAPNQQVDWWLSRLLEDRRSADYCAERLARAYVGTENGPFIIFRRRRFVNWLSDSLHENVAYDQIVRRLISDDGIWTSSPAVNFVSVTVRQAEEQGPDPIRLAGRTTRAFLAMRLDCLQCHDDRLGNTELGPADEPRPGLQTDFHQLAAFFSEANVSLLGIHDKAGEPYRYKYLNAVEETTVSPLPPFAPELLPDAGSRRDQLAAWVTDKRNKPFARAAVNRVWALMFGRPLVEPIDDIPLYDKLPPGMDLLAADFAKHDFDLRRLIRLIAATQAFHRDSRADFEITAEHERQWAAFPLTRLRPEQVAGAIIQSSSIATLDANAHIIFRLARFQQEGEFVKRYGDTGDDEFEDRGGTITQRLLMMNGQLVGEKGDNQPLANAASKIALLAASDEKAVEVAYLAALTRRPTPAESRHFVQEVAAAENGDQRQQALADLFWVLFNSTEFSWNH